MHKVTTKAHVREYRSVYMYNAFHFGGLSVCSRAAQDPQPDSSNHTREELMIPIPIALNMFETNGHYERSCDRSCDRSFDSNMLIGSSKHTDCFAITLHLSLCMYMHRSTLVAYKAGEGAAPPRAPRHLDL